MGFSRQEYWSGLSFPSSGDVPNSGIEPASPAPTGIFFTTEALESPAGSVMLHHLPPSSVQFSSVAQSCPTLCDPMNHSIQASLSITNSRSSLRLTSIESVMPSSHLILRHPLLLLPPIPPSIRVFSNESTLCTRWSAAAAKSLQLCLTLCDPIDGSPPGSPVPGILQARTLEWVAISFSNA